MARRSDVLDTIVNLAKRRGLVYPSSEIYGGLRASWDYGPLGVELKNNVKRQWWKSMVQGREDVVGLDSSVILAREVWEASGHVEAFVDPLTECQSCHKRFRADHLEEAYEAKHGRPPAEGLADIGCPNCGVKGSFTEPKMFNGLLKTFLGPVDDESGLSYLRPETAQGIFINYLNVQQSARRKVPFGIGQVGKSFRNEITPGNFIFRTREFEQMEVEFFVKPGTDEEWHQYWIDERLQWYVDLGVRKDNLRLYEHPAEKLSHYSKRTVDVEYRFDFAGGEWGELEGIANRTDYDLATHSKASGTDLSFFDQESGIPRVTYCEPEVASVGLTEAQAKEQYGEIETVDFNLAGNGKSQILQTTGFVKLVREKDGPIVGVHMIGSRAGELIGEGQLIVNWEAYPEDVASLIHAHPTQNEALGEAALALAGKPLHSHN